MPLYGGEPYFSPDDVTVELGRVADTVEIPRFQGFWDKWKLWIAGAAIVVGASTGTLLGVASVHTCCSAPPPQSTTAPAVPVPIPTTTRTKCLTCTATPSHSATPKPRPSSDRSS